MKPTTAYRRAVDAGLQIDLSANKERLVVFGPKSIKDAHMTLLKRHCSDLWALLIEADNAAAAAIRQAKKHAGHAHSQRGTEP